MPKLLRGSTIQLLHGSIDMLRASIDGCGRARTDDDYAQAQCLAPETGLVGSAADLVLKACVFQVLGRSALLKPDGSYKTAGETLADFRRMLRSNHPRLKCLTAGVADPPAHLERLLHCTSRWRVLLTARAAGLHMAEGVSRDVLTYAINETVEFLSTLGESHRFSPYTHSVPRRLAVAKERLVLCEELAKAAETSADTKSLGAALLGLFLVLPDLPNEEPDWLAALDRVAVAPRKRDISCLLAALQQAAPAQLLKAAGAGPGFAVRVQNDAAIAISPQFLKRAFTKVPEQWHADVANANGRLEQGTFDPPPMDFVHDMFVIGLESVGLPADELAQGLTAHQAWPFVAASLSAQGTAGPVWFWLSATRPGERPQLMKQLERAAEVGGKRLQNGLEYLRPGIDAFDSGKALSVESVMGSVIAKDLDRLENEWPGLEEKLEEIAADAPQAPEAIIARQVIDEGYVGGALLALAKGEVPDMPKGVQRTWAWRLTRTAKDHDDREGVLAVLRTETFDNARTDARKALRLIDFLKYGPRLEGR
jgi:hypothetical protein